MVEIKDTLFLIMARGGSKGIPGKNIKQLNGKPLIYYSIDMARKFVTDDHICVSTDDIEIKRKVEEHGLKVNFLRPDFLGTDNVDSYYVELHAINHFEMAGRYYKVLVILQPTSPFRTREQVQEALQLFSPDMDMVVSVKEADANPYYNLFEEDTSGYIFKSKAGKYIRRQDCPKVYQYNGAVYVVNIASLKEKPESEFLKVKKIIMDDFSSVDLDKPLDWLWAEFLINQKG
jgi:CMP-N,N'-diacetyllegionaminic acid synthase